MRQYVYGAILFVFLVLCGYALFYRAEYTRASAEAEKVTAQLEGARRANERQQAALLQLAELRKQNDAILSRIYSQLEIISGRVNEQNKSIAELRRSSDEVRDYLDTAIPADLRRLLDNEGADNGNGSEGGATPGSAGKAVPAPDN